ncbi:MAG: ATP-binding protein [Tannerella sp.]|nr:ATP-binding protein [Tannerella sp.]
MARSIYDSRQRWTIVFILIAAFIIIMTVVVSNSFSSRLAAEERHKAEVWAKAVRVFSDSVEVTDPSVDLMLLILHGNTSIPVILCNADNSVVSQRNFEIKDKDTAQFLQRKIADLQDRNSCITIPLENDNQYLYYDESLVLKQLNLYPYIQLAVVFSFIVITFLALMSAKKSEQNRIWVGLSKETAHQLGTPISSLIAWIEYLKSKVDGVYLNEMEKDVKRLETIADRFSKIGSNPDLLPLNINSFIRSSFEYMRTRVSAKVKFNSFLNDAPLLVLMNESLFSWVIENLTKNAVDAMGGQGSITYRVADKGRKVYIDITDTGKGIAKSRFKTIFHPGYTTKARGWGLGLSLVKRIIESYPGGKIYVKNSEVGKGTTFRIELRKYQG